MAEPQHASHGLFGDVLADHANYYCRRNLGMLAAGVGLGLTAARHGIRNRSYLRFRSTSKVGFHAQRLSLQPMP